MSIFESDLDLASRSINLISGEDLRKKSNNAIHPLEIPTWSKQRSQIYKIQNQASFDLLIEKLQGKLENLLQDLKYDSVQNVLQFYRYYKQEKNSSFLEQYKRYNPKLLPEHHNCVGLVLELRKSLKELEDNFRGICNYFFIASCQQNLNNISRYTEFLANVFEFKDLDYRILMDFDKEHVVLGFKFELEKSRRKGTILFDPGFHVGKVIIVMEDGFLPHTGWFVQKNEENFKQLYEYSYSKGTTDFINWNEKTTKNGTEFILVNSIYIGREYLSYVEVTEKRNLVYFFKSSVSRDRKGRVLAGIYFKIQMEKEEFTVLYQKSGTQRIKVKFEDIEDDNKRIDKNILTHLKSCSDQINMPVDTLINILMEVKEMVNDKAFVRGLLEVEEYMTDEISGIWSLEDPDHVYSP